VKASSAPADVITPLRLHLAGTEDADAPTGRSASPLHTFARRGRALTFDVNGWSLLQDHPTIAFGDGGSLKSYLALYAAGRLAQQGTRVLLLDWELAGEDHVDRLHRLFGDVLPLVHHLRCDAPLVHEKRLIAPEVHRLGIQYLVFDSIGAATDGPPTERNTEVVNLRRPAWRSRMYHRQASWKCKASVRSRLASTPRFTE